MATSKEKLKEAIGLLIDEGDTFYLHEFLLRNQENKSDSNSQPKTTKKSAVETKEQKALKKTMDEYFKKPYTDFNTAYQIWYSKALISIKQILPDRYDEFVECYKPSKNRKEMEYSNYTISDFFSGIHKIVWDADTPRNLFAYKFSQQLAILKSCIGRLDSILSDIQGTLQAELFDNEITAAEELAKKGHLRSAGALAGVTLERHFATVAQNHIIKITKKNPTISDFNELFKSAGIYDLPTYRKIQFLGDIRNLSSHFKDREPTKEEIEEMLNGTQRILKTVF